MSSKYRSDSEAKARTPSPEEKLRTPSPVVDRKSVASKPKDPRKKAKYNVLSRLFFLYVF